MAAPTVFTKSSRQIVLDLINLKNNTSLSFNEVSFTSVTPMPADGSGQIGQYNTSVLVTSVPGNTKVAGSKTFLYRRVTLGSKLPPATSIIDAGGQPYLLSTALSLINTKYGLNLALEDVTVFPHQDVLMPAYSNLTLIASPASLVWLGQTFVQLSSPA
jgi:hypothetical protein